MQDHNPRQHQVGDDGNVSFSNQLDQFVTSVSDALDSADGVDDDDVEAVERTGQELVDRAEEELDEDTGDERQEDAGSARVEWDGGSPAGLEIVGANGDRHPTGKALQSKIGTEKLEKLIDWIEDVEEDVDELEADVDGIADDNPHARTPETGLEQLARLPDELLADESANVRRAVSLAEVWRDHASKAPVGFVLSSGELARVLRDMTDCRGHSQTASRVIDRLDQLGGDAVSVVERRGERRIAFSPDLVGRLEAMAEQPSPAVEGDAGHDVVGEEVA